MSANTSPMKIVEGTSVNQGKTGKQMEDANLLFTAPASPVLGQEITVAVVADGIGGQKGGEEASRIAIDTIKNYFLSNPTSDVLRSIADALGAAHDAILEREKVDVSLLGMGSTATVAVLTGERLFVGSVGDSRAYLLRKDEFKRITNDHTWVQEALDLGRISPAEAQVHPNRHVLRRYLGMQNALAVDLRPAEFLGPGDILLLCTDGLTDLVPDATIREVTSSKSPQDAANRLVDLALQGGGYDNITVMILKVPEPLGAVIAGPLKWQFILASPVAMGTLVLGNILLLGLVAFFVLRTLGPSTAATSTPTIELVIPPSGIRSPAAQAAVVGGTSAPTVTPLPTFTPQPTTPNWTPPPPPILRSPQSGFLFSGPDANVVFSWDSAGTLPSDVYYVLTIRKYVDNKLVLDYKHWTKETSVRLDPAFYFAYYALNNGDTRLAMRDSGNQHSAIGIALQLAPAKFDAFVTLYRQTGATSDGTKLGTALGLDGPLLSFLWGPPVVPTPTPCLTYGCR
ncbi:PP2C family protein-serine/threonine phosphatase [Petrachloros mirabilis]